MKTLKPSYQRHRFPAEIISHAVWLYHRFCLSFREVEELLAERGVTVTYESVRQWCQKFGPDYARTLKKRQGRLGDTWHIDEVFVTIQGQRQYLWRAVDQDGDVMDILVQHRRNQQAAERFFRRLLKGQGGEPRWLVTDKLRSYDAAHRTIMPTVKHLNQVYANNRAEVSHEPTRQQERAIPVSSWPPPLAGGPLSLPAQPSLSGLEGIGVCIRRERQPVSMWPHQVKLTIPQEVVCA